MERSGDLSLVVLQGVELSLVGQYRLSRLKNLLLSCTVRLLTYVLSKPVRVLIIAGLTLKMTLRGYPIDGIWQIYRSTTETCLKRVEHGGYE